MASKTTDDRPILVRYAWEHTHRELLGALIFAHRLAERGVPHRLDHVRSIGAADPDHREVLMVPFYYDDRDRVRYFLKGFKGRWLINLCYEQMHMLCARNYLMPDGDFPREHMIFSVWGPRYRDLLLDHGLSKDRVRIVGHPRFDIYHTPELLFGRDELADLYKLDADKPWILVPYNFNMAYVTPQRVARLVERGYAIPPEMIEGVARARDAFTDMVRAICERHPDKEVILRVHPAGYEAETIYKNEPSVGKNLHIIADYDIAHWISQAALTIVWNSTSSMEAMVAGRPVISYEPYPFSEVFDYDANRILPTFKSLDDVLSVVDALPNPELTYNWSLFEQWYAHRDGLNTARLADLVVEAQSDFDSYVCRASEWEPARLKWKLQKGLNKLQGKAMSEKAGPNPAAWQKAVETLSARPLGEYLK